MRTLLWVGALALACLSTGAAAQSYPLSASPDGWARPSAPCLFDPSTKLCTAVGPSSPLPTTTAALAPSGVVALTGTSTGAQTVGPFVPVLGRPITLALAASSWPGGNVQLLRSTDGGATKLPLTPAGVTIGTYSGPGADSPWIETESGATYYLSLPGAGITYRVAQ